MSLKRELGVFTKGGPQFLYGKVATKVLMSDRSFVSGFIRWDCIKVTLLFIDNVKTIDLTTY